MDPSESSIPLRSTFPIDPAEFDSDPRISFSKLDSKFILETTDGEEFEYDDALRRWIPSLDEALLEQQRAAYAVQGIDEDEPSTAIKKKKRKQDYADGEEDEGGRLITKKVKPTREPRERKNTAVYVTNLPSDVDVAEVETIFARCGVIAEGIDGGQARIKLYTDEQGTFKGDALVVYFRPESVQLAIDLLDDTEFRLGDKSAGKMRVAAADFSYKTQKEVPPGGGGGKEKAKVIKKMQKLNSKLADWDDDEPFAIKEKSSKWDKMVILKHMFTLEELEDDPATMLDIKEDIREECVKLGEVTNVVLYDKEPDGVASVRFSTPEAAMACVRLMHGRLFAAVHVEASIATGQENFSKSNDKKITLDRDETETNSKAEEGDRLEKFGSWLEESAKEKKMQGEGDLNQA